MASKPINAQDINWSGTDQEILAAINSNADIDVRLDDVTPLIIAVAIGRLEVVRGLLARGVNINRTDASDATALHWAVRYHLREPASDAYSEIALFLLTNGANINAVDELGYTPLMLACQTSDDDLISLLLEKSVDFDDANLNAGLVLAVRYGNANAINLLIEAGADVNARARMSPTRDNLFTSVPFQQAIDEHLNKGLSEFANKYMRSWNEEDSLVQAFISAVSGPVSVDGYSFELVGYKVRGRGGKGSTITEKELGADGIGLVTFVTPKSETTSFFLYQAKKTTAERKQKLSDSKGQCQMMLRYTAASQLLVIKSDGSVSFTGALAAASSLNGDPLLADLPTSTFQQVVCGQLLQGLMLSPITEHPFKDKPKLLNELKYALSFIFTSNKDLERVRESAKSALSKLGITDFDLIIQTQPQ